MFENYDMSLTESIATESLADVLGTISETTIDAALNEGSFRDIPVIGTIFGVLKSGNDIRNMIFLRKVFIFLKTLSDVTDLERKKFIIELETNEQKKRFGESIILLLERAEDMKKPILIANIIIACIKKEITLSKALRISSMIDHSYTNDLELLRNFSNGTQGENTPKAESLFSAGFLSNGGFDGGDMREDSGGVIYYLNDYGKIFVKYGLHKFSFDN